MSRMGLCSAVAIAILLGALAVGGPPRSPSRTAPAASVAGGPRVDNRIDRPSERGPNGRGELATPVGVLASAPLRMGATKPSGSKTEFVVPDPDRVGECPRQPLDSRVIRRGIDPTDQWPTWWHVDGSMTKRVQQRLRDSSSNQVIGQEPRIVVMRPADDRRGGGTRGADRDAR